MLVMCTVASLSLVRSRDVHSCITLALARDARDVQVASRVSMDWTAWTVFVIERPRNLLIMPTCTRVV